MLARQQAVRNRQLNFDNLAVLTERTRALFAAGRISFLEVQRSEQALLQAEAIRRFVVPVSRREVLAIRGGSELFRAVNNPLADAAFLVDEDAVMPMQRVPMQQQPVQQQQSKTEPDDK